jgi:PilZ domain
MKWRYKERIRLQCRVFFTAGSRRGEGRVLDLTKLGCLIESPVRVHREQSVELTMVLPSLTSPVTVTLGIVRWTNGKQFGVEFVKIDEPNRLAFNRFMAQHRSEGTPPERNPNPYVEPGGRNKHLQTSSISRKYGLPVLDTLLSRWMR